ncbi:MAG: hypothetical protein NW224_07315 [Leptolyngbyaceae cyanobacterium bins.302]|nr:hypothetical protein [Leptolyngbyaceae cyanobacterium bins.302]
MTDMTRTFSDSLRRSRFWHISLLRLGLVGTIALVLSSCTPSKISQCNKLADSVNKMRPIAEEFQQENKNFDAAAKTASAQNNFNGVKTAAGKAANGFNNLTQKLDGLINDIQGVNLQDETLVGLKQRYAQNAIAINASFKEISTALTTISTLENSPKGLQTLNVAGRNLTATAQKMNGLIQSETKLVEDFNQYCEVKQ